MRSKTILLDVCTVLLLSHTSWTTASVKEVSHEDIRDAILSLVHMFRDNTDKLERHEYRERQLGDQLKKSFTAVEKKLKTEETATTTMTDILSNIDKRLKNLEDSFKPTVITEQLEDLLRKIDHKLSVKISPIEHTVQENAGTYDVTVLLSRKVDELSENLNKVQLLILALEERTVQTIKDSKVTCDLSKLDSILNAVQTQAKDCNENWQRVSKGQEETSLDLQKKILEKTQSTGKSEEIAQLHNATLNSLQSISYESISNIEKYYAKLEEKIVNLELSINNEQKNTTKAVLDSVNTLEGIYSSVQVGYNQLLKEIKGLSKIEQVLIQTADNVLDTKRRIEYGTHQILLEVGELVKQQAKELDQTVSRRFDGISSTILDNQNGGLTNLSSKIETEISQVWRQIGIMYQTLTASAGALDRLQHQTEIYVNGSLSTMDSMEGKVGQITGRMSEVDENLNYLLGRLSLVTQEFNQIKTGLGDALDNIRSSFHAVQEKVKDVGPGPIPIPDQTHFINQLDNTKYETSS